MISILNKILLFTISLMLTLLLCLGLVLYFYGINISSLTYKDITVNGLYIKLDKKFIVRIDKLQIPAQQNSTNSLDDIQKDLQYIPLLERYFHNVSIEQLIVGEELMTVSYNHENIYFDNDLVNVSVKPKFFNKNIDLELYSLYLKDYRIMFDGQIKLDMKKKVSFLTGNFYYKDLEGTLSSIANEEQIEFHVDSSSIKDIKFVKDFVRLHKIIESWMYDNIKGKFKLNYLTGIIDIRTDTPKLVKLEGDANVHNASIQYHKKLKPIKTKLLTVKYKNDNLYFIMDKPTYKGIKVYGSDVVISSLMGKKPNIVINIKTKNKLTKDIVNIVQAFGGAIPITQITGATNSKLAIKIDLFGDFKTNLLGEFKTKTSTFKIKDFTFTAHDATVILNNDRLKILNSHLEYDNNLWMKLDLDIDLKTKKATGLASNINYSLHNKEYKFIDLKGISSPIKIDFSKGLDVFIEKLKLTLNDDSKVFKVNINDIATIYPHSQFLQHYNLNKGDIDLKVFSKDKITFDAQLQDLDLPLIKKSKKIESLILKGSIIAADIKIKSKDTLLQYSNNPNQLILKDIDVIHNIKENTKGMNFKTMNIKGENSNILIDDQYRLLSHNYEINFTNNTLQEFRSTYDGTNLLYQATQKGKLITLKNVTPRFFKSLINKEFFKSGTFDLNGYANKEIYTGKIKLSNTLIEPKAKPKAIVTSKDEQQSASMDNYFIKTGDIAYVYDVKKQLLNMHDVKTKGKGLDLDGALELNFVNDSIAGTFDASFLKGASTLIGKIPLLNYILLGDEQKFSVKAKVEGTFEDIKISTNTASSTVKAPFSILERIITLPIKAVKTINDEISKEEE